MKSSVTITRPANTTAYAANDVVGGLLAFVGFGAAGQDVVITSTDMRVDVAAVPAGMDDFKLHLFSALPATIADNAAFNIAAADRANYLGSVNLGTPEDCGDTLAVGADAIMKQLKMPADTTLFAYLVTTAGYTPAGNSEVYAISLHTLPA